MSTGQPRLPNGRYTFGRGGAALGTLEDPFAQREDVVALAHRASAALKDPQATAALAAELGVEGAEGIVCHVGQQAADEAYSRAGITPQQVAAECEGLRAVAEEEAGRWRAAKKEWRDQYTQVFDECLESSREYLRRERLTYSERQEVVREAMTYHRDWGRCEHLRAAADAAAQRARDAQEASRRLRDEHLSALRDVYTSVLSDIRPLGGTGVYDPRTKPAARKAFDAAMRFYPSQWCQASGQAGEMMARVSKRRAHYAPGNVEQVRRRVLVSARVDCAGDQEWADHPGYRVPTPEEMDLLRQERGSGDYLISQETRSIYFDHETATPPRGRGWRKEKVDGYWYWRRDTHRMKVVDAKAVPEITTNVRTPLPGQGDTDEVAIHELSHRFEATVAGVRELEAVHKARRTTGRVVQLGPGEEGVEGDWADRYFGKVYDHGDHEILSCSTQALFGGAYGGLVGADGYRPDPDSARFALGVLATV